MISVLVHMNCIGLRFHVVGEVRQERDAFRVENTFGMFPHAEFPEAEAGVRFCVICHRS